MIQALKEKTIDIVSATALPEISSADIIQIVCSSD